MTGNGASRLDPRAEKDMMSQCEKQQNPAHQLLVLLPGLGTKDWLYKQDADWVSGALFIVLLLTLFFFLAL